MFARSIAIVIALLAAAPVWADGPEDTVRWIYASLAGLGPDDSKGLAYLSAPEYRAQYFTGRMIAFFEANESYHAAGLPGCATFTFDKPGPVFDAAEANRSLTVSSTYRSDRQDVTASFSQSGALVRIKYIFLAEDDVFKIDDIAGPEWRVSRTPCKPRDEAEAAADAAPDTSAANAYTSGAAQYCYMSGGNALRLDVTKDGSATIALKSQQATGHVCEIDGEARWIGVGWRHDSDRVGGACRLDVLLTASQGMRLQDHDFSCKPSVCGPAAALDGLTFARSDQVDCAFFRQ